MTRTDAPEANRLNTGIAWLSVTAAVAYTATAEYQLAVAMGSYSLIAALLPVAIDAYVVVALRRGRGWDILLSLALMGSAQIAAHEIASRAMPVSGWLVAAVSVLVPISLWRTHSLAHGRPRAAPAAEQADVRGAMAPDATDVMPSIPAGRHDSAAAAPRVSLTKRHAIAEGATTAAPKRHGPSKRHAAKSRPGAADRAAATALIRAMYDDLGYRPKEGEMVAALIEAKHPSTSRQFANKIRKEIEKNEPRLAALGSANVRAI